MTMVNKIFLKRVLFLITILVLIVIVYFIHYLSQLLGGNLILVRSYNIDIKDKEQVIELVSCLDDCSLGSQDNIKKFTNINNISINGNDSIDIYVKNNTNTLMLAFYTNIEIGGSYHTSIIPDIYVNNLKLNNSLSNSNQPYIEYTIENNKSSEQELNIVMKYKQFKYYPYSPYSKFKKKIIIHWML